MHSENNNLLFTDKINDRLKAKLAEASYSNLFILVDENTRLHCLPLLKNVLPDNYKLISVKSGEENKTLATCELIWQNLTDTNADRHSLLINLGGGVICDMGGFCARTYKRGIQFWNIPTTLLSQVDASIGGKLGVDYGVLKNHIGLFSEPDLVLLDSVFFNTLPKSEIVSGFAEMVKHSLIRDQGMFHELADKNILDIDWREWVPKSVAIKKEVVSQDPTEKGARKILNFGHTIGHAIESYYLHSEKPLKHGEAIGIGMIAETHLSVEKGLLPKEDGAVIINYLISTFPKYNIDENAISTIAALASQDKKNADAKILAVLLTAIGTAAYDIEILEEEIIAALTYYNNAIK
jgi:3-dehydroquinate synthase